MKHRFDTWKTSFKAKMQQTYVLVKHQAKNKGRSRITGPVHEAHQMVCSPTAMDIENFGDLQDAAFRVD